jgi:ABC-2 type transport system permease protein
MRNIWIIAKKEFTGFFYSPIAYVVGAVVFLVMGIYFAFYMNIAILYQYVPEFTGILDILVFPLLFLAIPVLTMKTLADENKTGTLELLLTSPVRDYELIVGKWLGTFLFFLTMIVLTLLYPLIMNLVVDPGIDQSLIVANYIGITLMASAMTAVGIWISSLFKNTIAALIASIGALLLLWLASAPSQFLSGAAADFFTNICLTTHYYNGFRGGVVNLSGISYYISLTVFALFLGTRSIETRRWR